MSKAPPPLLGFNNNVRHRGRLFHIQTEDSGVKLPRIVTHLFADGGRIVKTTRTDYTEQLQKPDVPGVVRGMMKEQHKAMFAALRAGELDALLEKACGPLDAVKPKDKDAERVPDLTSKHDLDTARVVVGAEATLRTKQPPPAVVVSEPPPVAEARALLESVKPRETDDASGSRHPISNPNLRKPTPSVTPQRADAFDLDVASLDKHPPKTPSATRSSVRPPRSKSVPPPRSKTVPPVSRKSRPPIPVRPAAAAAAAADGPGSLGRPQTRLAAPPPSNARSIFGDGAISEQSLDEVILSYLAEDLEETK